MVAEDDDGLGPTNARIPSRGVLQLPADGDYRVVVTSHHPQESGRFRLKVENFTHLGPVPTAVLPAERDGPVSLAEPAPAAGVNLSGTILYNSVNGPAPVRFALVWLFSQGLFVDTAVASSQTDANGNVSLLVPPANTGDNLYVRAYTQDAYLRIAALQDPLLQLGLVYQAASSAFSLPNAASVTFGTWNVAGSGQNGPFLMFDAAVEGYLIATQVLGVVPPLVRVSYPTRDFSIFTIPLDIDAHYTGGQIYLGQGYETSPDVVVHEYGHFMADVSGFLGPAGGPHSIPFTQRVNPILAWNEGWATFFAVAGQNAMGVPTSTMVSNHPLNTYSYNLADGHTPNIINDAAEGDDNEGSVQFIL